MSLEFKILPAYEVLPVTTIFMLKKKFCELNFPSNNTALFDCSIEYDELNGEMVFRIVCRSTKGDWLKVKDYSDSAFPVICHSEEAAYFSAKILVKSLQTPIIILRNDFHIDTLFS